MKDTKSQSKEEEKVTIDGVEYDGVDKTVYNCATCEGQGLASQTALCSICQGTGKVVA